MKKLSSKNIGIITFSKANNFGAMLQCYALSEVIKSLGWTPYLIDSPYEKGTQGLKSKIRSLLISWPFSNFQKKYLPDYRDIKELDKLVIGSDQVWNIDITGQNWKHFFGDYPDKKVFSYAASFGVEELDQKYSRTEIKNILSSYQSISVRETEAKFLLKNDIEIDSEQVIDPTLLLKDYTNLLGKININDDPYAAIFLFNKNRSRLDLIANFCKSNSLACDMLNEFKNNIGARNSRLLNVSSWLTKIKNSKIVITDSYHCMIFSILFKKKLLVLTANPKRTSRIKSLLNMLGLSHIYLEEIESISQINNIYNSTTDYEAIDEKIDFHRNKSMEFLRSSLESCN